MFHHITYIATDILTQVHAAMWINDIPTRPHELLHISVMVLFGSYTAESMYTIYIWCSSRNMRSLILPRPPPVCTYTGSSLSVECYSDHVIKVLSDFGPGYSGMYALLCYILAWDSLLSYRCAHL